MRHIPWIFLLPVAWLALTGCGSRRETPAESFREMPNRQEKIQAENATPATTADASPVQDTAGGTTGNDAPAGAPMGAVAPACERYIRYVCACAKKHPAPDVRQACTLASETLPQWQTAGRGAEEELAVAKACHRAFLYLQASGLCEDVEP